MRTAATSREESMGMGQFKVTWQMVGISLWGISFWFAFKQSVELYPRLWSFLLKEWRQKGNHFQMIVAL